MTKLIKERVQKTCKSFSTDELKALDALDKISRDLKKSNISDKEIEKQTIEAQKDVRNGHKKSRN